MKMREPFKVDVAVSIKTGVNVNLELPNMTEEEWLDMDEEERKEYVQDYLEFDDSSIYDEINDSAFDLDIEYEVENVE